MLGDQAMVRNRRQAFAGADPKPFFGLSNPLELAQRSQRDQVARRELSPFHFGIDVGTARHHHGVGTKIAEYFDCFS